MNSIRKQQSKKEKKKLKLKNIYRMNMCHKKTGNFYENGLIIRLYINQELIYVLSCVPLC